MNILLINGPNLNLLGKRETSLYGDISLSELENNLNSIAKDNGCMLKSIQSNAEHEIIETIHQAIDQNIKVIIINPAAYTHTSIAIRDALLGVSIPFYEIHISDIYSREDFRKFSYFSDIAIKVYCGLGIKGYEMALMDAISNYKET
jgi:3-dehydroquinate dehydratase-2|tara:strand:+ start:1196 stop:1636 length:441 start_codon:yes stop_codon:yes gene_type:complete